MVDDGWRRLTSTLPTLDKGSDVCTTTATGQVLSSVRREGKRGPKRAAMICPYVSGGRNGRQIGWAFCRCALVCSRVCAVMCLCLPVSVCQREREKEREKERERERERERKRERDRERERER